ncbi:MAG: VanZ family protein [Candidatus Margulisbacteria bacterium]|nr:VanZ family protein [Candidatus Margulisiibacteriota bacterium]
MHQLFVPNRDCSFADFVADNVGIVFGFILMKIKTSVESSWYNFLLGKKK